MLNRTIITTVRGVLAGAALFATAGAVRAEDKVTFGTNWLAEPEHGGFYQAVADGTYKKYGLDVTIQQGGPQGNNRLLLAVGKIDFYMGSNLIQAFSAVEQGIPTLVVAAMFQKDPQILMSHPGVGLDTFTDLKKSNNILLSKEGVASYFQWMKAEYGFKDEQAKPYVFNAAPFIADKMAVQQGYVTSEPFAVEREGKFKPNIFLLADNGFETYSTTVETTRTMVEKKPDVVKRFVEASIIGWYNYLYGDSKAANMLIKKDNPEMTDEQIAFGLAKMKEYKIIETADTDSMGIGAMTDDHIKKFFDEMVKSGVVKANLDYKKAYVLDYVNKGVGKDLKKN